MKKYKSWDRIYMKMALELAKGSKDDKIKVGCIITTYDRHQIVSVGVNGGPKGGRNRRISNKTGQSGFCHAEINALRKHEYKGGIYYGFPKYAMYVTHTPCDKCADSIVKWYDYIKEVYYHRPYKSYAKKIFKKAGIALKKI